MIQFLQESMKIISINSVPQNGSEEIAAYCADLMESTGFKANLQHITHSVDGVSKRQFNVVGIMGDTLVDSRTRKGLLLSTHLDTSDPGLATNWKLGGGQPFRATLLEDRIVGLGAANAKLDFLCKLKACERYRGRKLRMPIYLVGTAGSELGGLGARFLVKSMTLNPQFVVVGAPTGLHAVSTHKAATVYQVGISYNQLERDAKGFNTRIGVRCTGRSAHGGYPQHGDNAILRALAVIQKIRSANFQLRIAGIRGGDTPTGVPDAATLEFYIQNSAFEDFKKFYRETLMAEGTETANLHVEFGGLGDSGVKFLADNILDAVRSVQEFFAGLKDGLLSAQDPSFDEPHSTVSFSGIRESAAGVDLFFDLRLLPIMQLDSFEVQLKEAVQKLNGAFPTLMFTLSRVRHTPALTAREGSPFYAQVAEAQKGLTTDDVVKSLSISSEAAVYSAAGYESVAFGPGEAAGNSHGPDEHVLVDQLDKAVHFYDRLIERFCL